MARTQIVKVDERGRVLIPLYARNALSIGTGTPLLLVVDQEQKNLVMTPITEKARLATIRVLLQDVPGALAKAAQFVAEHGVDLVMSESRTLSRGRTAEWTAVADFSKTKLAPKKMAELIVKKGIAAKAEAKEMKQ
ncbi:MAG: ACT domain-containing protein [Candidatus Brockarchaeota archaeon]|nr:ACT domain-containing protein [Candidatus Brockarchaeota archaeon]